ncbi:MAG: hypothetical protein ACK5PF_04265, partial [bacterium]
TFAGQQTNITRDPVRDSCQLPVNAAKALREKISASDIAALKIITYKSAHKGAVADPELWAPKTRETADHSMLVAIAVGLIDGDITPATFDNARFLDADVLDLIGRTTVEISDAFTAEAPGIRHCRIEAIAKDGQEYVAHLKLTTADIERGPDDLDIERKYFALTRGFLPPDAQRRLFDALGNLDSAIDIRHLVDLTAI